MMRKPLLQRQSAAVSQIKVLFVFAISCLLVLRYAFSRISSDQSAIKSFDLSLFGPYSPWMPADVYLGIESCVVDQVSVLVQLLHA